MEGDFVIRDMVKSICVIHRIVPGSFALSAVLQVCRMAFGIGAFGWIPCFMDDNIFDFPFDAGAPWLGQVDQVGVNRQAISVFWQNAVDDAGRCAGTDNER